MSMVAISTMSANETMKKKRGRKPKSLITIRDASDGNDATFNVMVSSVQAIRADVAAEPFPSIIAPTAPTAPSTPVQRCPTNIRATPTPIIFDVHDVDCTYAALPYDVYPDASSSQALNTQAAQQIEQLTEDVARLTSQLSETLSLNEKLQEQVGIRVEGSTKIHIKNAFDDMTLSKGACRWCCHAFSTPAVHLPEWMEGDTFKVTGRYCSYNCCMADNLSMKDGRTFERSTLLHMMHQQAVAACHVHDEAEHVPDTPHIIPAPPRESLELFGGDMSIDAFRTYSIVSNDTPILLKPPFVSMTPFLEEISYKTKGVRLQRKKPLPGSENTLRAYMK